MNSSNRILSENETYRLYSIFENVYLKNKLDDSVKEDIHIASLYGDPDSGLISFGNDFIAIAGCGITVYFLTGIEIYELGTDANNILWTEGVYQSSEDGLNFIRFIARTAQNKIRVHRLDVIKREIEIL